MKYRNLKFTAGLRPHITGEMFMEPTRWSKPDDKGFWVKFSGWEPLMKVRQAWENGNATLAAQISDLSDYPQMVDAGDWSGIRDTNKEAILEMEKLADAWFAKKYPNKTWDWMKPNV